MAADAPIDIGALIVSRPELHSGRPCLAGTGMTVHAVAARHMQGLTADDILAQFPDLDLSRIYAALAYYYANKPRIEADLQADRRLGAELARQFPQGWTRDADKQ
jgi:uncharacterized protein (DUF433 family)